MTEHTTRTTHAGHDGHDGTRRDRTSGTHSGRHSGTHSGTHSDPHSDTHSDTHSDPHSGTQSDPHSGTHSGPDGMRAMAAAATLHCLTGCAIGEIAGLLIGTAAGLGRGWTIALSVGLAFVFGYALSTLPLLRAGVGFAAALGVVLAADTLSIATMEVVDNLVMALVPGAMDAGLVNATFWLSMMLALSAAFAAAYPVNRYLLARGRGHALTHGYHGAPAATSGLRRLIPSLPTSTLVAVIAAFLLGGLVVAVADDLGTAGGHAAGAVAAHRAP